MGCSASIPGTGDVLAGSTAGDAEGLPVGAAAVLGELHDLADVVGVVGDLAVDGVEGAEGKAADGDGLEEVFGLKALEGAEGAAPAFFPEGEGLGMGVGAGLEFGVAFAPGLVAVAAEEVGPAAEHVAMKVLDGNGDAVGLGVGRVDDVGVVELGQRTVTEFLDVFEALEGRIEKFLGEGAHAGFSFLRLGGFDDGPLPHACAATFSALKTPCSMPMCRAGWPGSVVLGLGAS